MNLRKGQRVLVHYESSNRESKEAVVLKVPPWEERVVGKVVEHTDEVLVRYPGTSLDGGVLFGDMREAVSLDMVEEL